MTRITAATSDRNAVPGCRCRERASPRKRSSTRCLGVWVCIVLDFQKHPAQRPRESPPGYLTTASIPTTVDTIRPLHERQPCGLLVVADGRWILVSNISECDGVGLCAVRPRWAIDDSPLGRWVRGGLSFRRFRGLGSDEPSTRMTAMFQLCGWGVCLPLTLQCKTWWGLVPSECGVGAKPYFQCRLASRNPSSIVGAPQGLCRGSQP